MGKSQVPCPLDFNGLSRRAAQKLGLGTALRLNLAHYGTFKESRKKGRIEGGSGGGESLGIELATREVGPPLTPFQT